MEEETVKFCDEVIKTLRDSGWCKTRLLDEKGRSCLLGAIGRVAGVFNEQTKVSTETYNKIGAWMISKSIFDRAVRAECGAARTQGFHILDNIIYYNDFRCHSTEHAINFIEKIKNRIMIK